MSIERIQRGYRIRFRPFGDKQVNLVVFSGNKWETMKIEKELTIACRVGDYSGLSIMAREACLRMFHNQGWQLPPELDDTVALVEKLTLWRATELFVNYPDIKGSKNLSRNICALGHVANFFGKERVLETIWIPDLKTYQATRSGQGAANETINRELSALSRLFTVMVELQLLDVNPVRLVKRMSRKTSERQVYLSFDDVCRIAAVCPPWFRGAIWTAYFTGMRRGEIESLTWKQVNLQRRMIYLSAADTKERSRKAVPIHRELLPILDEISRVRSLNSDRVFLVDGHSFGKETIKNPWPRAMKRLQWPDPKPRFHDLRHTWKVNALRSGVDFEIREQILGHWNKLKDVSQRYGYIDETVLLQAIDKMTFQHGETHIWVANMKA